MFLTFENIMYFLCSIGLFFWLNNFVIYEEEKYLQDKFGDEFERYCNSVKESIYFLFLLNFDRFHGQITGNDASKRFPSLKPQKMT